MFSYRSNLKTLSLGEMQDIVILGLNLTSKGTIFRRDAIDCDPRAQTILGEFLLFFRWK